MKRQSFATWRDRYAGTVAVICVLVLTAVLNLTVYRLTDAFSLYLYSEETYEHTVGQGVLDGFADAEAKGDRVELIFCMPDDLLEDDRVYRLVRETARQLDEAFSFLSVRTVDAVARPDEVDEFRYVLRENGDGSYERVEAYTVGRESVIAKGPVSHTVLSMSSFFVLNSQSSIEAYRGEEVMAGMIRYALSDTHPKAYFTSGHGESTTSALHDLLVCAGYELSAIDLLSETPDDTAGIFVVSNPLYDFYRGGEGVTAEIEKLRAYMENGGFVLLLLDPLAAYDENGAPKLPNLLSLAEEWGLSPQPAVIRDNAAAVTSDGYTVVCSYAEGGEAEALQSLVRPYNRARVLLREAAVLSVSEREGKTVSPLLVTSSSAVAVSGGKTVSDKGNYAVFAVSVQNTAAPGTSSAPGGASSASAVLSSDGSFAGGMAVSTSYYLGAVDALGSDEYGNAAFLYALFARYRGQKTPVGATKLKIGSTLLRDLTVREARLWTLLVTGLPTLAVLAVGFTVIRRRRAAR